MLNKELKELAFDIYDWDLSESGAVPIFLSIVYGFAGDEDMLYNMGEAIKGIPGIGWKELELLRKWIDTFDNNIETFEQVDEFIDYLDRVYKGEVSEEEIE